VSTAASSVAIRIWSYLACFSRPEANVERTTYPVMPPSAAAGFMQNVYFKVKEFRWLITSIDVLSPIQTMTMRFNEVKKPPSYQGRHEYAVTDVRTQRYTTMLKNPEYIIRARPIILGKPHQDNNVQKHVAIFNRKVAKGACFTRPCLGMRDFPAYFDTVDGAPDPIPLTEDLGPMPLHIRRLDKGVDATMFNARLENGRLNVPSYEELLR